MRSLFWVVRQQGERYSADLFPLLKGVNNGSA
jgi:hypothetical protein